MPSVGFDPAKHGFRFSNAFVNHVLTLPGGQSITTLGRCGGMAFAALDYYVAGLPVPDNSNLPADGTLIADYIYKRLIDSFALSGPKFVSLTLASDHRTWVSPGLTHWTKVDEFTKIRNTIDRGHPMILGLIHATSLGDIGLNHQVLAFGYESDPKRLPVVIYDNNHPKQSIRLTTDPADPHFHASTGEEWRGFFVEWYNPVVPDYLVDGTLLREKVDPRVYVIYGGAKFLIPDPQAFDALGLVWSKVREVGQGSMAYIADTPAEDTLLREYSNAPVYVIRNRKRCFIPNPECFEAYGFDWNRVRIIPDGTLAQIPDGGPLPPVPTKLPQETHYVASSEPSSRVEIEVGSDIRITIDARPAVARVSGVVHQRSVAARSARDVVRTIDQAHQGEFAEAIDVVATQA